MVRPNLSLAILTTCRLINREATSVLTRTLHELEKTLIQFFLSYGAAHCVTQGRLLACLSAPNRPSWDDNNQQVKEFMARCSTFLAHTRRRPLAIGSGYHVKFNITTDNGRPGMHDIEPAIMEIHERARATRLVFQVTIRDDFPTVTVSIGNQRTVVAGNMALNMLRWKMRRDHHMLDFAMDSTKVSGKGQWKEMLGRMKAETKASEDRRYSTGGGSS
jgi:hypothetical protein